MGLRVLIVDDHKIMREGLRSLLEKQPDIEAVTEAESAQKALKLVEEFTPNLIIIDVVMPSLNGIEATRRILSKTPSIKVIALSMYSDKRFVMEMLRAGASGYLLKDSDSDQIVAAIRQVFQGLCPIAPSLTRELVTEFARLSRNTKSVILTRRQREVLKLVAEGISGKEIGNPVCLSSGH